ncbi:MAG: helix-turn-helix domain-containing protein [Euryarchaeota archaeon]|nr:helix-turn-helix domain-containing protein [Euryarchaeota archaeon]
MVRGEKELADDFAKRIVDARKKLGLDKRQLGHKIAEKVNVIQAAESGKRPTDALIKKLERFLKIELMVETTVEETSMVGVGSSRGLTLGDFFKQNE